MPGGDLADIDLQHVPHDHVVDLLACYPRRHSGLYPADRYNEPPLERIRLERDDT
jgi:hypothetical protein